MKTMVTLKSGANGRVYAFVDAQLVSYEVTLTGGSLTLVLPASRAVLAGQVTPEEEETIIATIQDDRHHAGLF